MTHVLPGQLLALLSECIPSSGTHVRSDKVYSSLLGTRILDTSTQPPTISVIRPGHAALVPQIGSIVVGRIIRINPRFALVSIQMIDASPCSEPFSGLIRLQDIRATERDKVQVYDCFRPGDIIRASVISLGDAQSFYLSTAQNDLGVIFATSAAGNYDILGNFMC